MLKKLISGAIAGAILLCGTMTLACSVSDREKYRVYSYDHIEGTNQHFVEYVCYYEPCDDPFTVVGPEDCPYEDWGDGTVACLYCGYVGPKY